MNDKFEKRRQYSREYYRKYRLEHPEKLRKYNRDYYNANKVRIKQNVLSKYMSIEEEDIIEREKLIEKIDSQRGYVDMIDCYRIINVYCSIFFEGDCIDQMDPLDQIAIMYERIKKYKKEDNFTCIICKKTLPSYCFSKYAASKTGFNHKCKSCCKEYRLKLIKEGRISDRKEYNKKWRIENPDKVKQYVENRKK